MSTLIDSSRRTAARVAGVGYLALFVLAIFANFIVKQGMIDPSDAEATVAAIREQETLFRTGLAAFVAVFLIDIPVAWALYVLFAPGGRARSLLIAWFRIAYTVMLGVATVFLFLALEIAKGAVGLGSDVALLMVSAFDFAWFVGLSAFGFHLVLLGALISPHNRAAVPEPNRPCTSDTHTWKWPRRSALLQRLYTATLLTLAISASCTESH